MSDERPVRANGIGFLGSKIFRKFDVGAAWMSGRFGKIAEGIINPGRLMRHVSVGYDGFARYFAADEKPDIDWESDDPFADFLPTEDEAPFVESKHPRDKSGKFAMTAGGGTSGKKKAAKGSKKSIVGELLS